MAKEHSTEPTRVAAQKSSGRKFELHRVEIERADHGGFIARHHFRPVDPRRDGLIGSYKEPETSVHNNMAEVHAGLSKAFGEKAPANVQEAAEEVPEEGDEA